mmetsp:Transcript_20778/g.52606  ORF Transcript_20778/g.52606 Transcript_20778/m.52606 type:complete len:233 (+) Transcript_20778:561-1259(+)
MMIGMLLSRSSTATSTPSTMKVRSLAAVRPLSLRSRLTRRTSTHCEVPVTAERRSPSVMAACALIWKKAELLAEPLVRFCESRLCGRPREAARPKRDRAVVIGCWPQRTWPRIASCIRSATLFTLRIMSELSGKFSSTDWIGFEAVSRPTMEAPLPGRLTAANAFSSASRPCDIRLALVDTSGSLRMPSTSEMAESTAGAVKSTCPLLSTSRAYCATSAADGSLGWSESQAR